MSERNAKVKFWLNILDMKQSGAAMTRLQSTAAQSYKLLQILRICVNRVTNKLRQPDINF